MGFVSSVEVCVVLVGGGGERNMSRGERCQDRYIQGQSNGVNEGDRVELLDVVS